MQVVSVEEVYYMTAAERATARVWTNMDDRCRRCYCEAARQAYESVKRRIREVMDAESWRLVHRYAHEADTIKEFVDTCRGGGYL